LYLDGGHDAARVFVVRFLEPEAESVLAEQSLQDAKSAFQEQIQRRWRVTPHYVTVAEDGPPHERRFVVEVRVGDEVWGTGMGHSKATAARRAAQAALDRCEAGDQPLAAGETEAHA
jgi:ribonuclease-3